ncbi:MAG TPA: four helix bundle protein [Gemmatimonadaceae bacterium]|nr:four helix bundle protein [Gemmatimonadaceae bacterium]
MTDFKKLKVWEKSHSLAVQTHKLATEIREPYLATLRNQMTRASASIPTNIVEGSRQASNKEFARFLRYSMNSASELEYHFILARDIGATREDTSDVLIDLTIEVRKMLYGLLRRVASSKSPSPQHDIT